MAKASRDTKPHKSAAERGALVVRLLEAMHRGVSVRAFAAANGCEEATLRRWCADEEYSAQYARAREAQADAHVDEALAVAAQASSATSSEQVAAARLLVDTLKWRAAKFRPRIYGDKAELTVGGDAERPVEVRHTWRFGDREIAF